MIDHITGLAKDSISRISIRQDTGYHRPSSGLERYGPSYQSNPRDLPDSHQRQIQDRDLTHDPDPFADQPQILRRERSAVSSGFREEGKVLYQLKKKKKDGPTLVPDNKATRINIQADDYSEG